ncbi:MAG: type II toxin-antitoxin system VapC family toxin [Acidobacteria bacterium]|nr:type II toxin-antitoxin system VapC family toxin [Acidobacteriota bacterium]
MIVPDTNLLVYAYNDGAPHHEAARRWWEDLINGAERVGLPWMVSTGFVRLMTHPRVLRSPVSPVDAIAHVRDWFRYAHVSPINAGAEHLTHVQRNLEAAGVGANLVTDAHIAALAMEYQAEVHSNDSDFSRFPGLRWRNPL